VGLSKQSSFAADPASLETLTLSIAIETDPLLFGKLMETGLNDFVLRQNLVMAGIADLLSFRRRALQRLPDLLPPRIGAVSLAWCFNAGQVSVRMRRSRERSMRTDA
jgi:hypothetical protein